MNSKLFEILGKYGGIGGISLGVFFVVVLAIIKVVNRNPGASSLRMCRFLAILAFILGLAGLLSWTLTSRLKNTSVQPANVETSRGVAAGGKIKNSEIEVAPPISRPEKGASPKVDENKTPPGVSSDRGVAAGGNIEDSKIKVGGQAQTK